jgi:acetyl esterase/lipase
MKFQSLEEVELWPGGAPGAEGCDREDRPWITGVLPETDAPMAAVVVCPGGGYRGRADHEGLPVARWLARRGVAGIVLHYRVFPYRHPVQLTDARRAIRTVRSRAGQWNIDPDRVGIMGFSAGGHLAVSAATIDEDAFEPADEIDRLDARPDLFVACYPVVTFGPDAHVGSREALLGPDASDEMLSALSLESRVTASTPPGFIWHTADDNVVPPANALRLAEAMIEAGRPVALHVFPRGRHGLGLAEEEETSVRTWPNLLEKWLIEAGFADTSDRE